MLEQLLKFSNKRISHLQLLGFRHFSDYAGMRRIYERPDHDVYVVELKNANYFVVEVMKMDRQECIKECQELIDNGADQVEVFEFVEDNTDLDPADIINELFY